MCTGSAIFGCITVWHNEKTRFKTIKIILTYCSIPMKYPQYHGTGTWYATAYRNWLPLGSIRGSKACGAVWCCLVWFKQSVAWLPVDDHWIHHWCLLYAQLNLSDCIWCPSTILAPVLPILENWWVFQYLWQCLPSIYKLSLLVMWWARSSLEAQVQARL